MTTISMMELFCEYNYNCFLVGLTGTMVISRFSYDIMRDLLEHICEIEIYCNDEIISEVEHKKMKFAPTYFRSMFLFYTP